MGFAFTDKQEETCDLTLQVVSEKTHYGNFFDRNTNPLREIEATSKINTRKKQLTAIKPCWTSPKYDYDYQGRRISKKVAGQVIQYVYDGWNMIAEFDGLNAVQATHTWGQDLSGSMQGAGGVGGLLSTTNEVNNTTAYPTYDANGNISEYLDSEGTVQAHYQYDEFGKTLVKTGSKADDFNFRFSTKYNDQESGLLYYGYRYYQPQTGKWSSRDPIGESGHELLKLYSDSEKLALIQELRDAERVLKIILSQLLQQNNLTKEELRAGLLLISSLEIIKDYLNNLFNPFAELLEKNNNLYGFVANNATYNIDIKGEVWGAVAIGLALFAIALDKLAEEYEEATDAIDEFEENFDDPDYDGDLEEDYEECQRETMDVFPAAVDVLESAPSTTMNP